VRSFVPLWLSAYAIAALFFGSEAKADPLKSPKRTLNGVLVDLSPLFRWWTNHTGARPLTAWVHVTGTIVGTNALGWTVQGTAERRVDRDEETESVKYSDSFILKNPPVADLTKFDELSAKRAELSVQLTAVTNQTHELSAEKQQNSRNRLLSRQLTQEISQAKQTETGVEAQIKDIDKQLERYGVKATTHALPKYKVDCFALEVRLEISGVPVYDHGRAFSY
jgi:hypothetical protein